MTAPEERLAVEATTALKAQIIRESATEFVDTMATKLIGGGHFETHEAAYREVAIQATFNSTVIFEALPDSLKQIFKDQLLAASGG